MHAESPAYNQFEPDYEFTEQVCHNTIVNEQFGNLAFSDDELIGLMIGWAGNIPWVKQMSAHDLVLYVKPEFRNGTVGIRLIRSFEDWALDKGIDYIFVGVSADINASMVNQMFIKMGYEDSGSNFRKHLQ